MTKTTSLIAWALVGIASAISIPWTYSHAFPGMPDPWEVNHDEAVAIALEAFRNFDEPLGDPFLEHTLETDPVLEHRLEQAGEAAGPAADGGSSIDDASFFWRVTAYGDGARTKEWMYKARVSATGTILDLLRRVEDEEAVGTFSPAEARSAADRFLTAHGFDLERFEEPEVRTAQLADRTEWKVRYRDAGRRLGEEVPYGIEVSYTGDRLEGFGHWYEDPDRDAFLAQVQGPTLWQFFLQVVPVVLTMLLSLFFLRRYHEGEIGVRRGFQLFAVSAGLSLVFLIFTMREMATGWNLGLLSRAQTVVVVGAQIGLVFFLPVSILCFLSWSLGELYCRELNPRRLAAFDALVRGNWTNATVARSALVGTAAGLGIAALSGFAYLAAERLGGTVSFGDLLGPWWQSIHYSGVAMLIFCIAMALYGTLFARLLLVSAAVRRFGPWLGVIIAGAVATVIYFPPVIFTPWEMALPVCFAISLLYAVFFLRQGLAATLIATVVAFVLPSAFPYLLADDGWLQLQGWLPVLATALPLLISVRYLGSKHELTYRWDDVPPHVRRIAERERQRVELETARRIQSSILPDLPPQLNGVELAHAYKPASEVGGDFYDVLALEDGRLAVAVGDVAGHGVSSGLVMSMARSALAVQVTFQPEVEAVFTTLNRVVYQSARKRLLTTLCYAVLDPKARELVYASAGHLYPYQIKPDGRVYPLEYGSYPLGVREAMQVEARRAKLEEGDTLFLLSDGLVEAHPEGNEDLFGFERLMESLRRHASLGVAGLRDAVLEDIEHHTGGAPQEDDQTVLVLRIP